MKRKPIRYISINWIIISLFVIMIFLPLAGSIFGWSVWQDLGEKRSLVKCPVLGADPIELFLEKFDSYFKDHFGFRNTFIRGYNHLMHRVFMNLPSDQVILGKNNWLYLVKDGAMKYFMGRKLLPPEELAEYSNDLEEKQSWMKAEGIHYLYVVIPNKTTIYPEFLPNHIQRYRGRARLDQLLDYFAETSNIEIFDLRDALHQAKMTDVVYHSNDTHWNSRGAFFARREICKQLKKYYPDINPDVMADYKIETRSHVGDLAMMLGLGSELQIECEILVPLKPAVLSISKSKVSTRYSLPQLESEFRLVVIENNARKKPSVLIFHDSFMATDDMMERFSENFSRSVFVWWHPDTEILKSIVMEEKPDIVIEEYGERAL
ncbi:MAG: hypothetical protein JRI91_14525 [Deltaproteobacteria bacterium]|nr:hypothetical protein [Deltaproteobacteria bacterium]